MVVAPAQTESPVGELTNTFGITRETLRLRYLQEKAFTTHNNENCPDQDLVRRYPERFSALHGEFKVEIQLAADSIEDRVSAGDGPETEILAKIWLNGLDRQAAYCYLLGKDGNWYLKKSNKPATTKEGVKGVYYWDLEEAVLAQESDMEMLKKHLNSLKEKEHE